MGTPSKALIVREPWATLLVEGKKTLELRKTSTKLRGIFAIASAKSGYLLGTVVLTDCRLMSLPEIETLTQQHCVSMHWVNSYAGVRPCLYGWSMCNAQLFQTRIPYTHKQGAVTWVNL